MRFNGCSANNAKSKSLMAKYHICCESRWGRELLRVAANKILTADWYFTLSESRLRICRMQSVQRQKVGLVVRECVQIYIGKRDLENQPPIVRQHLCQQLCMPAKVRFGAQHLECQVVNLSESGCKVIARFNSVQIGAVIFVRPQNLETLIGRVVWVGDDQLGVKFEHQVYRPVVDHLVKANASQV